MWKLALCSCLFISVSLAKLGAYNDIGAAYDHVLSGYNKHVLPKNDLGEGVNVTLDLTLIQLDEIKFRHGSLTAIIWLQQKWNDPRLRWNPDDYNGVKKLVISSDDIWVPDTSIYNSVKPQEYLTVKEAVVSHDGAVTFIPSLRVSVSCSKSDFKEENTNVTCDFRLGSWPFFPVKDLDLYPMSNHLTVETLYTNPTCSVEYVGSTRFVRKYDCCPESYALIMFTYRFHEDEDYRSK